MNIQNLINGCLAVCITLLIFNTFENKDKIVELENALDNSNKMQIESAYRQYVDDFIENEALPDTNITPNVFWEKLEISL